MISDQSPLAFADPLPSEVDAVVIGGGVIGCSTAWFLTQRGLSVALLEKGRIAGEQSSRNWGWIRQHGRDPAELPIVTESLNHWEAIAAELDTDIGFRRTGVLYLANDELSLARKERWLTTAREHDVDSRMVTGAELRQLVTDAQGQWVGGAYTPSDGRAEPFLAVPAIARRLREKGVVVRESCAVRALDVEAGRLSGVVSEHGRIRCALAICAGGAWTALFARPYGAEFPQLTVRATVLRTAQAPEVFSGNAASDKIAFRRRQDGGYTLAPAGCFDHYVGRNSFRYLREFLPSLLRSRKDFALRFGSGVFDRLRKVRDWSADEVSPFELARVLNPDPSGAAVEEIRRQIDDELPSLKGIAFEEAWAGMIDATPDVVPVMDRVDTLPGFFLAAGFSGHGFGIGPGAGRVMADLMTGEDVGHDLSRFRLRRFSDGSRLELGPAL